MTSAARAKFIAALTETDGRWEATLTAKAETFHGHRIVVRVETWVPVWEDRSLTPGEIGLLTSILQNLPGLLDQAKGKFDRYARDVPRAHEYIAEVCVLLAREVPQPQGANRWSLVIQFLDSDSMYLANFDGLQFIDAWGGD